MKLLKGSQLITNYEAGSKTDLNLHVYPNH